MPRRVYTELLRMDFIERQQFPHSLWGECYAYVNSLISSAFGFFSVQVRQVL